MRIDIQALRGWAVLIVVLNHVGIGPFGNGHLGVDVFFVLSGFLITSLIVRDLNAGSFSFFGFYARRARRLFPAAFVTYALTAVGSIWFLASLEMQNLVDQLLGALTFTSNIVLYLQVDYFDADAALKPLLHTWSLGVEEQFYLLLPLLLFCLPARFRLMAVCVVGATSAAICFIALQIDRPAAFYLLPFRAWELMIGAVGAFVVVNGAAERWLRFALWPAIIAMIALPIASTGYPHPGLDALIICTATLIIILSKQPLLNSAAFKPMALVGDISYSLYLVHWPIISFANNAFIGGVPVEVRIALLLLSFAVAAILYRFVETPTRHMKWALSPRAMAAFAVTAGGLGLTQWALANSYDNEKLAYERRVNYGMGDACEMIHFDGTQADCMESRDPSVLVWGDSFAMHLVPGVQDVFQQPIAQATMSACPPMLGSAPYRPELPDPEHWATLCTDFNASVIDWLVKNKSVETVIVSTTFRTHIWGVDLLTRQNGGSFALIAGSPERAREAYSSALRTIIESGKSVIFVGPPPGATGGVSLCSERLTLGKVMLGEKDCLIPPGQFLQTDGHVEDALASLAAVTPGLQVRSFSEYLCTDAGCVTQIDGTALYRDEGHLSVRGSQEVMPMLNLTGGPA